MDNKNNERLYYLAFSYFAKIGATGLTRLEKYFPNLQSAFLAHPQDLIKAGLSANISHEFASWRLSFRLEDALEELRREEISFVTWREKQYPERLKQISDPPPVLYFKGQISGPDDNYLAVVGSRRHSSYGEKIIKIMIPQLTSRGIEIISGLAIGIDCLAHQAAIDSGGRTMAVLGSGLKKEEIYPYSNRRLAQNIINSGGALISEFPPRTPAYKQNFPRRNRLIAGLAVATLVIEAGQKSGSLITAQHALEENRDVLAFPGNIFSESSLGANWLIKSGAKAITEVKDILEIFNIDEPSSPLVKTDACQAPILKTETEKIIYAALQDADNKSERLTADEIHIRTALDMATINSTLSILEIEGLAESDGYSYHLK